MKITVLSLSNLLPKETLKSYKTLCDLLINKSKVNDSLQKPGELKSRSIKGPYTPPNIKI